VAAGAECSNLAFDNVWVASEAEVVVAADLDVARPGCAPLEGVTPLPELDLALDVVVVDACFQECRLFRAYDLAANPALALIGNSKQHFPPSLQ